jgi:hypothetical protein
MLRNAFIVFLLGWVTWFWIDKPPPEQQHLPEVSDSLVENFQVAFDMVKAGYPKVAFVYIWNAHYLLHLGDGACAGISCRRPRLRGKPAARSQRRNSLRRR